MMKKSRKKEEERIKKRKHYNKILFIFLVLILFIFLIVFLVLLLLSKNVPPELTQGDIADDFCTEKCGENKYYTSYNNSGYNFIRCECVVDVKFSHSEKLGISDSPKVDIFYFDSKTLEGITKKEILSRIKDLK